jgi:phospholipid/cholesterol/gamma-HCH transport system substrate-binding protein
MKRDNINYTLVGIFALLTMALLVYTLARLSGHGEKHDSYFTTFPNVAGISDGSPVTYDGYQVGHVQSVEPVSQEHRTLYRVQLLIKHDWKIPADSAATISSSGLLSGQLINIEQGKSQELLKPGQDIRSLDNPPLIAALGGLASDLRTIARDDMRPALQNMNKHVESLSTMLEHKGGMTLDQANATLVHLNGVAENMGLLLNTENRQHMSSILKNGDQTTQKVDKAVSEFEQTQVDIHYAMQQTQTILSNLERASRHMNELSRQLRENPSSVFSSPAPVDPSENKK